MTADTAAPPNPIDAVYRRRWLILAVVLAAECRDLIDSTVVNVAAPPIARDFSASSAALEWILSGYPLAISVGLILGGRLGDLYGRRTMFLIGTSGFVLASALCGLSPDAGVLITARLIQGSFAALMLPQGFGVLRETFPEDERQKAFALFAVLLVYPLIEGRDHGWPWWTYGSMSLGVLLVVVFALQQRSRDRRGLAPVVTQRVLPPRVLQRAGLRHVVRARSHQELGVRRTQRRAAAGHVDRHRGLRHDLLRRDRRR
jgi:MFS family permease